MRKKNFLLRLPINFFRYLKLRRIIKRRKKDKKNNPLEDYNYPLW